MQRHPTRTWLIVTALIAVVGAIAAAPGAGGQSPSAAAPRASASAPLGDPAPAQGRDLPGLATDPADPNHVVEVDENFALGECTFRTTFDGGRTWAGGSLTVAGGPERPVTTDPTSSDNPVVAAKTRPPCDAFDHGGFAHSGQSVAFGTGQNVYTTFSAANSVVVARSTDGGRSFAPATEAIGAAGASRPFDARPHLAVVAGGGNGGSDRIYVSASNPGAAGQSGPTRLLATTSDDGGTTWSPVVEAQGEGDDVQEAAQPSVAPDGTVYLVWRNGSKTGTGDVVVARSVDGGATWTRARAGDASGAYPYVVAQGQSGPPSGEATPSGTVHLVWRSEHDGATDISYSQSTDGGATWSASRRVSDDAPREDTEHLVPRLSVGPGGRLDVVWIDTRSSYRSPVAYGEVWYSSSGDGGQTFAANRRINDHSISLGPGAVRESTFARSGPVVVPLGGDRLLFAWGDSRNGGTGTGVDADPRASSDVYMATMDLAAGGPLPDGAIPDTAPEQLSVDLSRLSFPGGAGKPGSQRTTRVVVVNATDDTGLALSAAVLARANESPLLLSRSTDLTSDQKDEVARLAPGGAYLVGAASRLSDKVVSSLAEAGAVDVDRITGSDSTDTARRIAQLLDTRAPDAKARGVPAFDAAVIVNSQTGDAATGSALAAALRMPILFTQRDALPVATTEALRDLNIENTLVVGSPASISDTVVAALPGATRLGGDDPTQTSEAVALEARSRNVAANVVYVTDGERPIDQAALGATVARVGGLMLAEPDASADEARKSLDDIGLTPAVDRLVGVRSNTEGSSSALRMTLAALIFLLGVAIIVIALVHRDPDAPEVGTVEDAATRSRVPGRSG